jgi:predicted nucleotidyltransferase
MDQMRLDDNTREIIKIEVAKQLGAKAVVRLFGSRVDDTQCGGDIDLLVDAYQPLENRIKEECRLSATLYIKLGGRKVDVLIRDVLKPLQPIHEQALRTGIIL